ncbi:MAG: pyridoxamine 5'-phosphate oxidase family protein [Chloroflexota bacterium]|nr:pyridoxamine 5'-phosphate oxidase family protein [Chloroflexota bacterium]
MSAGTWADLEAAAPKIAAMGRELMYRNGDGEGMLVTVSAGSQPRVHPVNVGVVDGHLYAFVQPKSGKAHDLATDGRFALHAHYDPQAPHEFQVRDRARLVDDPAQRDAIAANWFFNAKDYPLYELLIEHALLGERPTANDWPPLYSSWKASGQAADNF